MVKSKALLFILMICSTLIYSQKINKTDSLIGQLDNLNLSKLKRTKLLLDIAIDHSDLKTSIAFAKKSLQLATEINNPILQGEALEEISILQHRLGNNNLSLEASINALQIYESLDLRERLAAVYAQIANNYLSNENYNLAISYLKRAKKTYGESENIQKYALTILNLGETYRLATYLDSAQASFKKVLDLNREIESGIIQGYSQGNLGMVYNTQNKLLEAKENLNDAITILRPLGDAYSTSVYIAELGEIYNKENEFKIAEAKFIEALTMAKQAGLKEQIRDFSAMLTNFYEEQKQYAKALGYQKLFQVYQDSLVNKANVQKMEQIKAEHEIEKRESKIDILNIKNTNQKYWVIGLTIGASILLLFAYLLHKGNIKIKIANNTLSKQKIIITKREEEKTLLLRELNHRIKNNLQMISSLLNLQSRELTGHPAKEAIISGKHRVEALSLVHRKLYQEDLDSRIQLKEYIQELVLGLFHGYNASFEPDFEIDDISISLDMAVPLALVINEVIINALKYAYKNIDSPKLKLVMLKDKTSLNIQVIDNGIGFKTTKTENGNSFGIKLIYSLIEQLEGVIQKLDSKNGTHWTMKLKLT